MRRLSIVLPMSLVLGLGACRLELPDNAGGNDVNLDLVGTQGAELSDVSMRVTGVDFRSAKGTTSFDVEPRDMSLFTGDGGTRLLSGADLSDGDFDRVTLRVDADPVTPLSTVSDTRGGLFPLDVPGGRISSPADLSIDGREPRTIILVLHTRADILPVGAPAAGFQWRDGGYVVVGERAGQVDATISSGAAGCPAGSDPGQVVVFVFRPGDTPRDIRGGSGDALVSFALTERTDGLGWQGTSPPLPEGDWDFAFTCRALDDDPDAIDQDISDELAENVQGETVIAGQTVSLSFDGGGGFARLPEG